MAVIAQSAPNIASLELDGVRLITLASVRALVDHGVAQRLTTLSLDGDGLEDLAIATISASAKALQYVSSSCMHHTHHVHGAVRHLLQY